MKHYFIPTKENGHIPKLLYHNRLHWYGFFGVSLKIVTTLVLFTVFPSQAFFSSITSEHIIRLVNEERAKENLSALSKNSDLESAASLKAQDMFAKNYFAHYAPDGTSPWDFFRKVHYQYTYAGENLGMGFSDAESLVKAWMNSPKHRKNIMNPAYREIGISVQTGTIGDRDTTLAVQMFGTNFLSTGGAVLPEAGSQVTTPSSEAVSGAERVVTLSAGPKPWWAHIADKADQLYKLVILALIILLLLKIFVRVEIQHARIIVHAIFVIFLFGALLLLQTHFLEGTLRDQLISIL